MCQEAQAYLPGWPSTSENPHNPASASHINQLKWYPSNHSQYVSEQRHFNSMQEIITEQQTFKTERFSLKMSLLLFHSPSQCVGTHTHTQTHHSHTHTEPQTAKCPLVCTHTLSACISWSLWPCPSSLFHLSLPLWWRHPSCSTCWPQRV